jgi:hypothetical protein
MNIKRGDDRVKQMPPINKPKAHQEAVYQDTHWDVDREVNWEVKHSSPTNKSKATGVQSTKTHTETSTEKSTETLTSKVYQVNQDSTEASFGEHNNEVDRMVTEVDFQSRLPSQATSRSQCHLPMITAWEILYEALRKGSSELRHTKT